MLTRYPYTMTKRLVLIIVFVAAFAGGWWLRSASSTHAGNLTTALVAADTAGAPTAAGLAELKAYVHAHMGARATFTLQGAYNRDLAAAQAAASAEATNSQIYAAAQAACSGKTDSITQAKCNQAYLSQHLVAVPTTGPVAAPQLSSYQYKLRAPWWTPDLAGGLFALAALCLVALGFSFMRRQS